MQPSPKCGKTKILHCQIFIFGNPPNLRAISSFNEPVDITGSCHELKNRCDENMDYLPKSPVSLERAKCALRERQRFKQIMANEKLR